MNNKEFFTKLRDLYIEIKGIEKIEPRDIFKWLTNFEDKDLEKLSATGFHNYFDKECNYNESESPGKVTKNFINPIIKEKYKKSYNCKNIKQCEQKIKELEKEGYKKVPIPILKLNQLYKKSSKEFKVDKFELIIDIYEKGEVTKKEEFNSNEKFDKRIKELLNEGFVRKNRTTPKSKDSKNLKICYINKYNLEIHSFENEEFDLIQAVCINLGIKKDEIWAKGKSEDSIKEYLEKKIKQRLTDEELEKNSDNIEVNRFLKEADKINKYIKENNFSYEESKK